MADSVFPGEQPDRLEEECGVFGVYAPGESTAMVDGLLRDGRIQYKAPADYRQGAPLEQLISVIIAQTATREKLERRKAADLHDAKSRLANAKQGQ